MNLDRVKQTLKKVNALIENLDDQGKTSSIERDLLLRYLRDLYEDVSVPKVIREEISVEPDFAAPAIAKPDKPVAHTKEFVEAKEQGQTTFYDASLSSEPEVVTRTIEPQQNIQPVEASINKFENPIQYFPPTEETVTPDAPTAPVDARTHVAQTTPMTPAAAPVEQQVSATTSNAKVSDRFDSLFVEKSAQDLADKYKLQSVVTIEGAMGINERMLTINELFGGEHNVFIETVTNLNSMTDLESALKYLTEGVADRFNWDAEERLGMASGFVQLVRRKFA